MIVRFTDFNDANDIFQLDCPADWAEIEAVLRELPLHLKPSDQANRRGTPIFDAVGTNRGIKEGLTTRGWKSSLPIPDAYRFLGTDVDFAKNEVIMEVQFSNYPFLLNNTIRSELFFKAGLRFTHSIVRVLVIISKAGMFPSSNSTLYYEQAVKQLTALSRNGVFDVPIRLVGLFEATGEVTATWTQYTRPRYSREVAHQETIDIAIRPGPGPRSIITFNS